MATSEQIDLFSSFAKQLSEKEGAELPLAAIFDRWLLENNKEQDLQAIQAADEDYNRGERGRPVAEFLQEFNAASKANQSQ